MELITLLQQNLEVKMTSCVAALTNACGLLHEVCTFLTVGKLIVNSFQKSLKLYVSHGKHDSSVE